MVLTCEVCCEFLSSDMMSTSCVYIWLFCFNDFSRKLAMLAGVPLALARNIPGAGLANSLILSDLTHLNPPPGGL